MSLIVLKQFQRTQISSKYFSKPTPDFLNKQIQTPMDISNLNFFDFQTNKINLDNCEYEKAKKGYGVHAGFQIKCGPQNEVLKVKFGNEIYSGPFNSRIYPAVGYLAPQINPVERLKLKYKREILTEFNQRQKMYFNIHLIGLKITSFSNFKTFDPFSIIESFEMKDGSLISLIFLCGKNALCSFFRF